MPTPVLSQSSIEWSAVALVSCLLVVALPIVVVAYYILRLSLRRKALVDVLRELDLESEYLRLYDVEQWEATRTDVNAARQVFLKVFDKQWRGDTRAITYAPPCMLLLITTLAFVSIVLVAWSAHKEYADLLQYPVLFAMGGAFVYVYPRLIQRYGSLTLNPQVVYESLGILWISVLTGVVAALAAPGDLKVVAAFVGSVAPVPTLLFLRDRLHTSQTKEEATAALERANLLELIGRDEDLFSQLGYIGIRSVRTLATENPVRIFADIDPNLYLCIEMVDRANLWQWVPDPEIRSALNTLGVRTAVDLMTQGYELLPDHGGSSAPTWRFLGADEKLPAHLVKPFESFRVAMKLDSVETFRNFLAMMSQEPQLYYLQQLWQRVNVNLERAFPVSGDLPDLEAPAIPLPAKQEVGHAVGSPHDRSRDA